MRIVTRARVSTATRYSGGVTPPSSPPRRVKAKANGRAAVKRARPKIGDVATLAGVSLGTVSAVLNGNGRVSTATRERVREAIASLGYRPDLYASNLARRRTQILGVIVSNLQNPFFAETAQAIEEEAARHGYQISLMATNFSPELHRAAVKQLLAARLSGIAVMTSEHDTPSYDLILASGVPSVFLDVGKATGNSSSIRVDSRGGMQAIVSHLLQLGHRDLLFVRNSQEVSGKPLLSHKLRDQGFAAAVRGCAIRGLQTHVIDLRGPGADAGEMAIAKTFGTIRYTAVIAITDLVAMGVYRGLQSRKVRIPQDISVVGFDNTYFSRFLTPPLTTVDVSRVELSRSVVRALLDRSQGSAELIPLGTSLVLRESTAAPGDHVKACSRTENQA